MSQATKGAAQDVRVAQIEAVLYGSLYDWAVQAGVIRQGPI